MNERSPHRRDVVVVGGGPSGLSAALSLVRAGRSVSVIDAGAPRNSVSGRLHGFLGQDGVSPSAFAASGRDEVTGYGGEIINVPVARICLEPDGFDVMIADDRHRKARKLIIASGSTDVLPTLPGLRERWGRDVLHCANCQGHEIRGLRVGVIANDPDAALQALKFRHLCRTVELLTRGYRLADVDARRLAGLGIPVTDGAISHLEVDSDRLVGVRMSDGQIVEVDAVAVTPRVHARAELYAEIGIRSSPHPLGTVIETDPYGRTAVTGVWAVGNAADPSAQVAAAVASGARAAQQINVDLTLEDADSNLAAENADT